MGFPWDHDAPMVTREAPIGLLCWSMGRSRDSYEATMGLHWSHGFSTVFPCPMGVRGPPVHILSDSHETSVTNPWDSPQV